MQLPQESRIAVIGLGYVGGPLSVAFAKAWPTLGFDIDPVRIGQLNRGLDATGRLEPDILASCNVTFTGDEAALRECNTYIIALPTPIEEDNVPMLRPLKSATELVGRYLNIGDVVVYESTVHPGATEEVCVPILQGASGLALNEGFRVGYSPELVVATRRINDGMGKVVSTEVIRLMNQKRIHVVDANIFVLGLALNENCPDIRNTRVISITRELEANNAHVDVHDPWVDPEEAAQELGFPLTSDLRDRHYDAVIVAVAHERFRDMGIDQIRKLCERHSVVFDVKYLFGRSDTDGRL